MTKRNKRKKAAFGIDDAIMLGVGLLRNIISADQQHTNAQNSINAQRAAAFKSSNAERASILQSNLNNLVSSQQEEKNRIIPTQTSALRLGGRRCKKCGGGRLIKFI